MNNAILGILAGVFTFLLGAHAERHKICIGLQTRCVTAVIKNVPNLSGEQLPLVRAQCEIAVRETLE